MLAEAVSLDGGTLVLFLVIFAAFVALAIGMVVAGFVWAGRAGRGSQGALVGFIIVAVIEVLWLVSGIASGIEGNVSLLSVLPAAALVGQVVHYRAAQRGSRDQTD